MKTRVALLLILASIIGAANSETAEERRFANYKAESEKRFRIDKRIRETRPDRRETPVRPDNISDEEVREIQRLISEMWPGAIINIATVVVGCPCEDGPSCTDQVWIVGYRPEETKGLLLSRIGGQWKVGPVQLWWFDYERLQARRSAIRWPDTYWEAEKALKERFPACNVPSAPAGSEKPGVRP